MRSIFIVLIVIISACSNSTEKSKANATVMTPKRVYVTPQEAKDLIESENIILIDLRTPEEIAEGYIEGARKVDYFQDGAFESLIATLDPNKPVLVYCQIGGRSFKAAEILETKGFIQIYDLDGGMEAWMDAGLPISD